jgi:sec-independent protein translocase protein TatC
MIPIEKLGIHPVIIGVTEGFFVRLKVAIFGGIIVALPIIIWQVLRFVFPALYSHEKRIVILLMFSGVILFIGGIIFSYMFILDMALRLMLIDFSGGLSPFVSFEKYLSFVIMMLLPFGLVFETPIVALVLTRIGIITPAIMSKNRKFVIMIIFVLAAILTPPDIISQVFLAGPMFILYEISIFVSRIASPRKESEDLTVGE